MTHSFPSCLVKWSVEGLSKTCSGPGLNSSCLSRILESPCWPKLVFPTADEQKECLLPTTALSNLPHTDPPCPGCRHTELSGDGPSQRVVERCDWTTAMGQIEQGKEQGE